MNSEFPIPEAEAAQFGAFAPFLPLGGQMALGAGNRSVSTSEKLSLFEEQLEAKDDWSACCLSALWLFHDELDRSHSISQEIHTAEGSYLHGIMHRREGDYSNAKYWFRKAGDLEFFDGLAKQIQGDSSVLPTVKKEFVQFDPFLLTDLVSQSSTAEKYSLERVTFRELLAAFEHCYRKMP